VAAAMRDPADGNGKVVRLVNLDEDRLCVLAIGPTAAFREGRAGQVETTDAAGRTPQSGRLFLPDADVRHVCGHYVGVTTRDRLSID
jgi:hypothetical protein